MKSNSRSHKNNKKSNFLLTFHSDFYFRSIHYQMWKISIYQAKYSYTTTDE
jgi:hypothetical protein